MASLDDKQQYSLNALLYDAVIENNVGRVEMCLSRGAQAGPADMSAYFRRRGTKAQPLAHLAFKFYNAPIVDALARAGLQVDEKDSDGDTALGQATASQRQECVKHFLKLGASPLCENNAGKTVLDIAREDNGYDGRDKRNNIIDELLAAVPAPCAFNEAAKKAEAVTTAEAITVSKPISLTPHKKEGFQL